MLVQFLQRLGKQASQSGFALARAAALQDHPQDPRPHREARIVHWRRSTPEFVRTVHAMLQENMLQFIDTSAIISSLRGVSFQSYLSDKKNGRCLVSPLVLAEVRDEYKRKCARLSKHSGSFFPLAVLPEPEEFVATIRGDLISMGVEVVETTSIPAETIASILSYRQLGGPHRHGDLADILHALTLAREVVKNECDGILITGDGAFRQDRRDPGKKAQLPRRLAPLSSYHSSILQTLLPGVESYSIKVLDPKLLALGYDDVPQDKKT